MHDASKIKIGTLALATCTTGVLMLPNMNAVYDTIETLLGWRPFTNQIPAAFDVIAEHVKPHLPEFPDQDTVRDLGLNRETTPGFMKALTDRWGAELEIPIIPMVMATDPVSALRKSLAAIGNDGEIAVICPRGARG